MCAACTPYEKYELYNHHFAMINNVTCNKVLTLGCDWRYPLGGVARVLNSYNLYVYKNFRFVKTTREGCLFVKICTLISAIISLILYCIFSDVKIIHIHGSSYNSFKRKSVLIRVAKFFNKKIVYHIHGGEYHTFYRKNVKKVKEILSMTDVIITLSNSWKDFFVNEVGCENVVVVPNITPYCPPRMKMESRRVKNVVFIGTLCRNKGVYDIVQMCIDYQNFLRNHIKIYLCGSGEVDEVRRLVDEHGISDIVSCTGAVDYEKISEMLNMCDVYILPSYNEGLPISILEAMSHGLPIISTPVGGIPEIVTDGINGYLITPGDTEQLYSVLETIMFDDIKRKKMGAASYSRVSTHFPDSVASKLEVIYEDLLGINCKV